mgnify:CR=1 FL=1
MANSDAQLTVVVPGNPAQRTGGYGYVRAVVAELKARGWSVRLEGLPGRFPVTDSRACDAMHQLLGGLPKQATVVIDGLALGGLPDTVEGHARRLRLFALVHHPLALETGLSERTRAYLYDCERRALGLVDGIITTSAATARELADYGVPQEAVTVIRPGVSRAHGPMSPYRRIEPGSTLELLCLAHLAPRKGQDILVDALAPLAGMNWHLSLVGSTGRDPDFTAQLKAQLTESGLTEQVTLTGELDEQALAPLWDRAHGFILPSRCEGYGMVIDEALAAGLAVLSSDGGALAETADRPGIRLHMAGNHQQLQHHIREWLNDPDQLYRQTKEAHASGQSLRSWSMAADEFAAVLHERTPVNPGAVFASDWLRLRETADHAARDEHLTTRLREYLERAQSPLNILDLGAGTGSNQRYLGCRLQGPQQWCLVEPDSALVRVGRRGQRGQPSDLQWVQKQVTTRNLDSVVPGTVDLITASALLDLMGSDWLESLARTVARRHAAVLMVLNYCGRFELQPVDAADQWLCNTVNAHQHRNKGTGAAAGPQATSILSGCLERHGFQVITKPSPWILDYRHTLLMQALMSGWCEAARELAPAHQASIDEWQSRRHAQLNAGKLGIRVEHTDLLALPPGAPGP